MANDPIDDYIASCPTATQARLQQLRRTIHRAAPGLEEAISYRIAAFRLGGRTLIHMAGFDAHIGLYPVLPDTPGLDPELARRITGKATLKLPLREPVPLALIATLVKAMAAAADGTATGARQRRRRQ